jgi:hypothetical protein
LNKTLAAVLAAGAALATAGGAVAENWYAFYIVPSGLTYVDKDSLVFRPGHVTARIQSNFPGPQRLLKYGQVFTYTKSKDMVDIDCEAQVFRYLSRDLYSDAGLEQLSINEADDVLRIANHTPQAALAKAYCPTRR